MNLINGTNIGDGLRVGTVTGSGRVGVGGKTSPFFTYIISPGTAVNNPIVATVTPTEDATTKLTLQATAPYSTFVQDPVYGQFLKLDYARVLSVTFSAETTATSIKFTIDGFDDLGNRLTEEKSFAAGTDGTNYFQKAFAGVFQIKVTVDGATTEISMGVTNRFGLPYALTNPNSIEVRPVMNANPSIWCEGIATLVGGQVEIYSPFAPAFADGDFTPGTGLIPTITVLPREGVTPGTEIITATAGDQSDYILYESNIPNSTSSFYWRMNYDPDQLITVANGQCYPYPSGYADLGATGTISVVSPYVNTRSQFLITSYPIAGDPAAIAPYASSAVANAAGTVGNVGITGTIDSSVLWEIGNPGYIGGSPNGPIRPYFITADRTAQLMPGSQGYPGQYYSTATAGDVRGIVGFNGDIGSQTGGGRIALQVWMYLEGCDSTYTTNQTSAGLYGVNQYVSPNWGK